MINCTGHLPPCLNVYTYAKGRLFFPNNFLFFSNSTKKLNAEENIIINGGMEKWFFKKIYLN